MKENISIIRVCKYAGAYMAFEIGSGFATGQEILQFYTSYGLWGFAGAMVSMVLFAWSGGWLMAAGAGGSACGDRRIGAQSVAGSSGGQTDREELRPYQRICGRRLGRLYEGIVVLYLFAGLAVMLSGAGASIRSGYGISSHVGSMVMALAVLLVVVLGLARLIDVLGLMGPLIILVTIFLALWSVKGCLDQSLQGAQGSGEVFSSLQALLRSGETAAADLPRPAANWLLSGLLYTAYNMVSSVAFLMAAGREASSPKEAAAGGIVGGVLLMATVMVLHLALLLQLPETAGEQVPTLYLAKQLSPIMATVFVIIMFLGIFSTAAPMLWTMVNSLAEPGSRGAAVLACFLLADALVLGQLPFDRLVSVIYPLTGYLGIFLLACIGKRHMEMCLGGKKVQPKHCRQKRL